MMFVHYVENGCEENDKYYLLSVPRIKKKISCWKGIIDWYYTSHVIAFYWLREIKDVCHAKITAIS